LKTFLKKALKQKAIEDEGEPLNDFQPRPYQVPILKALDMGYKKVLAILPRRAGKDITALNYMIMQMYARPGVYYYIFPEFAHAKRVIWDSITCDGKRVLDYFPKHLVIKSNSHEMKITMSTANGGESLFQLVGANTPDKIRGTNPIGCVFSEYADQDPQCYMLIRPVLANNGGWALFISTPRGKNHLWDMYNTAKKSKHWFSFLLTLDDTKHISQEEIDKEREEAFLTEDLIQQEYYCSFTFGVEGAYYTRYLDRCRFDGRITKVPWDPRFKVHTAWDIGVRDHTSIIFFQEIGKSIHIIDCFEKAKMGLEFYAKILEGKPYLYGKHFAPHDINIQEWGSGITRIEKASQLGIDFTVCKKNYIAEGIEACRSLFPRLWIDEVKCRSLVKSIESYRQEFDSKLRVYKPHPLHDWSSHFCDCLRYLACSLPNMAMDITADEIDEHYRSAIIKRTSISTSLTQRLPYSQDTRGRAM